MRLDSLLFDHPLPDDAGLIHTIDRSMSAGEARASARTLAAALQGAGVEPGQAVATRLEDSPEAVVAMFGIWAAGAVFVPVNPRHPAAETAHVLDATGAVAVIGAPDAVTERHDGLGVVVPEPPTGWRVQRRAPTSATGDPAGRSHGADTAFATFTSGTTGRPKAVLHGHTEYLELLDRVLGPISARRDRAKAPMPNLIPTSLALNAGIYNVLFGFRAGAPVVLLGRFDTQTFATLVSRHGIRSTVLPPAAMTMLADDASVESLAPLRYVRSITAALSPLQARRFMDRFGVTVLNSYGQAETGEVIGWTAADANQHPEKLGAAGRPLPGVQVAILDGDRTAVAPGETGELWVLPPSRTTGYASGESVDERVGADGFWRTGDLAHVDADGFVWIDGRVSDVINRGGNKVFPAEVEEVLALHPAVSEASVIAAPDDRLGEVPVAFCVTSAPVSDDELVALCRDHLTPYKVPVAFHAVSGLPRNEIGKVLRSELLERHREAGS